MFNTEEYSMFNTEEYIRSIDAIRSGSGRVSLDLFDTSFAHCGFSNNPVPPTTSSRHMEWNRSTGRKTSKCAFITDHVIPQYSVMDQRKPVAWLLEPLVLNPGLYDWVRANHKKFYAVLSHDLDFFGGTDEGFSPYGERVSNFLWVPFGGCWIPEEKWWTPNDSNKPFTGISIVASEKTITEGHRMRHDIIKRCDDEQYVIFKYGRGINPVTHKHETMQYKYQVVIENERSNGYFTEKLIDCLVSGVVPIYWGCPDLAKYGFDEAGIIRIDSVDDFFGDALRKIGQREAKSGLLHTMESELQDVARVKNAANAKRFLLAEDFMFEHYHDILVG